MNSFSYFLVQLAREPTSDTMQAKFQVREEQRTPRVQAYEIVEFHIGMLLWCGTLYIGARRQERDEW